MDVDYETTDELEEYDDDLLNHYDNLALYRPSKIHIHGLKYDIDYSTDQPCFYIQDIDEASECFERSPVQFLWQSIKTCVTLVDESQLAHTTTPNKTYERTFKRRTKPDNEGHVYLLQEHIIHEIKDETNESIHIREHTWRPQKTNIEDTYTLATLVADKIHSKEHEDEYIYRRSTQYGASHDEFEVCDKAEENKENIAYTDEPLPGALGQLTYYTEKLIHIKELPKNESNVDGYGEDNCAIGEEKFEADNLNVRVLYGPAVMWMAPYEDRRGFNTSLFQLSEKFGDTYERRIFKVTTDDKHHSDLSLSMSEVKEFDKYVSACNEIEQNLEDLPVDTIVIDAVQERDQNTTSKKHDNTSDSDDFEELQISQSDDTIPIILVNGPSTPSKSNFRNAGLKERLANNGDYILDDTNHHINDNLNQTTSDTFNSCEYDDHIVDSPISRCHDFVDSSECYLDDVIKNTDQHYYDEPTNTDDESPIRIDKANIDIVDHIDKEVESYIKRKYGAVCYSDDDKISSTESDISSTNEKDSPKTPKKKFSLLELSREAELELEKSGRYPTIPNSEIINDCINRESKINNDESEKTNSKECDALYIDHIGRSSDHQCGMQKDICNCYFGDAYDASSIDGDSDIADDCNYQPTWNYPTFTQGLLNENICTQEQHEDNTNSKIDNKNIYNLNSFNGQEMELETINYTDDNVETGSDSGFENIQQQYCEDEKALIISSNSDLVISLSSNDDDTKQTDTMVKDKRRDSTLTKSNMEDIGRMESFILSIKESSTKALITEYLDEDINIQWRSADLDHSEGVLPKRSLLDLSKEHKTTCTPTKEFCSTDETERVAEYLRNSRALSHNLDTDTDSNRAFDMNSFICAVKTHSNNKYKVKHADDESDVDNTLPSSRSHEEALGGRESTSSVYFKNNSFISFGSEDEYLQLPLGSFKPNHEDISFSESADSTGSLCESYDICIDIDGGNDICSIITSMNTLGDELRIRNPEYVYVAEGTPYEENLLLHTAKKRGLEPSSNTVETLPKYGENTGSSTDSFSNNIAELNTSLHDEIIDMKIHADVDSSIESIDIQERRCDETVVNNSTHGEWNDINNHVFESVSNDGRKMFCHDDKDGLDNEYLIIASTDYDVYDSTMCSECAIENYSTGLLLPSVIGVSSEGITTHSDCTTNVHNKREDISFIKPSIVAETGTSSLVNLPPSKDIKAMKECHNTLVQPCNVVDKDDSAVLMPSRVVANGHPIKEVDVDYTSMQPQSTDILQRFSGEVDDITRYEGKTEKENAIESNAFLKSFKELKDRVIQQLRSQMPFENSSDNLKLQPSDSNEYHFNSRDNIIPQPNIKMSELLEATTTKTFIPTKEEVPVSSKRKDVILSTDLVKNLVNGNTKDTHEEANEVGVWVISINNAEEEGSENSNEVDTRTCYVDVNAETDFHCNTDHFPVHQSTINSMQSESSTREEANILKHNTESSPMEICAPEQTPGNDIQLDYSSPAGRNMNEKVDYKAHQLKYGASEDVDHVIVLPNRKLFSSSFESDFLPNANKEVVPSAGMQPTIVDMKQLPSPSIVSTTGIDICNENKNYFLVDDQSKAIIEGKECCLFDDQPSKENIEEKNYVLLDTTSKSIDSESFNWYIDNEPNAGNQSDYNKQTNTANEESSDIEVSSTNHKAIHKNDQNVNIDTEKPNSSFSINYSPARHKVQFIVKDAKCMPVNSSRSDNNVSKGSGKLHIKVNDTYPTKSPRTSPTCRSVLCIKSEPKKKNASSAYGGEINAFELYGGSDENISIYDTTELLNTNRDFLGRHSKSWAHGLNSSEHAADSRDYHLCTSTCDLTTRKQNFNSEHIDLKTPYQSDKCRYFDIDSSDFYFNSRDMQMTPTQESRYKRSESLEYFPIEGTHAWHEAYDKQHVVPSLSQAQHRCSKWRSGSVDCLYTSNYKSNTRTHKVMDGRRLYAGYSYLSLHSLPPDHEIVRSSSHESRARELEIELNFIRNERRKAREEGQYDFKFDESKQTTKDVGNIMIPKVFDT